MKSDLILDHRILLEYKVQKRLFRQDLLISALEKLLFRSAHQLLVKPLSSPTLLQHHALICVLRIINHPLHSGLDGCIDLFS